MTAEVAPAVSGSISSEIVLEADGLTKHFPISKPFARTKKAVRAVEGVSFQLRKASVTALVGESGSGKSTVARLLAQLYPLTSGEIRLHGANVAVQRGWRHGRKFRAYCRQVQMIFQDPFASLNPVHTIRYHLTRSLTIHGNRGDDLETSLAELLTRVHLTPAERYLDRYPHELSGGQRQRVAIARALAASPEVLLADEPVSMLDVSIRLGILNLLRDLKERLHLSILYITHDIASARYFADETIVMYAGQVVEGGDSETVTQRPAHPYTQLLIESAPDPDRPATEEKDGGSGEPPSLIEPPPGCRFHPRCPFAMDVCRKDVPPRFELGDGHFAACWLYREAS